MIMPLTKYLQLYIVMTMQNMSILIYVNKPCFQNHEILTNDYVKAEFFNEFSQYCECSLFFR